MKTCFICQKEREEIERQEKEFKFDSRRDFINERREENG